MRQRKTVATFSVVGAHVDGKTTGTLTIEPPAALGVVVVSYRPHGSQRTYVLTLPEVAEMIAWRAAKKGVK